MNQKNSQSRIRDGCFKLIPVMTAAVSMMASISSAMVPVSAITVNLSVIFTAVITAVIAAG